MLYHGWLSIIQTEKDAFHQSTQRHNTQLYWLSPNEKKNVSFLYYTFRCAPQICISQSYFSSIFIGIWPCLLLEMIIIFYLLQTQIFFVSLVSSFYVPIAITVYNIAFIAFS